MKHLDFFATVRLREKLTAEYDNRRRMSMTGDGFANMDSKAMKTLKRRLDNIYDLINCLAD